MQHTPDSLPPVPIAVAPNGGRRTKADHPALPMTPEELARTAAECLDAGAAMIHVHVRDRDGKHLLDAEAYRQAIGAIRAEVRDRLVIQITTEALGQYDPDQQMEVVRAVRPEAVSLALREVLPSSSGEATLAGFLQWLKMERIAPQFILYDPSEALLLDDLRKRGVVPYEEPPVLYVLGRYTVNQTSLPRDLLPFLAEGQPRFPRFMVCAFGRFEADCTVAGALFGGGLRVGFENNLFLPDGRMADGNGDLVATVAESLKGLGIPRMTGEELRQDWATL